MEDIKEIVEEVKIYTHEEAMKNSIEYFNGDELAANVFVSKYALKDKEGNIYENTPEKMHRRIAKEFARIEKNKFKEPMTEDEIFSYLDRFEKIIPQGSPMYGIGNPFQTISVSNCFVVPSPLDSYSSILTTDQQIVHISKRRGGCGVDLSNLRPVGSPTNNAARSSTGVVSWMERYSKTIREVCMHGRRGALLETISVHHPEVVNFINAKRDKKKVTGANVSVRLTDEFLEAVKEDKEYELRFPVDYKEKGIEPKISKYVKAKEVWNEIITNAWRSAEPGIFFWDNIIKENPSDCYEDFQTISLNPCGELPLSETGSCILIAMNIFSFVKNPFTKEAFFDYENLKKVAQVAQRLIDDLVDLELECIDKIIKKVKSDPEPIEIKRIELDLWKKIKETCGNGRRTGLGMTALGDTLAALGIKYGSEESIKTVGEISKTLKLGSYRSSIDMAKEIGSFPVFDLEKEKDNPFLNRIWKEDTELYKDYKKYGRRNIVNQTVAPCGSLSIESQTTSGIEPLFSLGYKRRKKVNPHDKGVRVDFVDQNGDKWQEFMVYHPKVKTWMDITGETDVEKSPWFGCCAEDLDWESRIKLQAAVQVNIDNSISSTINVPENTTKEEIDTIYRSAWKEGLKGITVYRKNSRTGVLIDAEEKENKRIKKTDAPVRPKYLPCEVHHPSFKHQRYYVVVGLLENDPYEVFTGINHDDEGEIVIPKRVIEGKVYKKSSGNYILIHYNANGEEEKYQLTNGHSDDTPDAMTRMISTCLRHGTDISFVVHQLEKTKGDLLSFSKVIARTIKKYIKNSLIEGAVCAECGSSNVEMTDGCQLCRDCGGGKCS